MSVSLISEEQALDFMRAHLQRAIALIEERRFLDAARACADAIPYLLQKAKTEEKP